MQETLQFLIPVMESLEKVHENNIIHRDLSPDNIMVLPDGSIKLIDFGAAHEVRRDEMGYQQSTTSIVKHGFAPPEQYTRKGNLGTWTDVYAMSATVYYCLTGHVPPSVQDRQFDGEEISWEGISPTLRQILERGLSLNLSERIQTMTELRTGLTAAIARPGPEYPTGTVPLEESTVPVYTAPLEESINTIPVERPKSESYAVPAEESKISAAANSVERPVILDEAPNDQTEESLQNRSDSGNYLSGIYTIVSFALILLGGTIALFEMGYIVEWGFYPYLIKRLLFGIGFLTIGLISIWRRRKNRNV